MNIQHQDDGKNGVFLIENSEGKRIAELTYFYNHDNVLSIDHTWVDDSLRGQGVAKQLFDAAIAFARTQQFKIIPICSYAAVMFQRDAKLRDVLAELN